MDYFYYFNPSPIGAEVGDCVIRAICAAEGKDWNTIYCDLCIQGYTLKDMPSSNAVWGEYLKSKGYKRHFVDDNCPLCYTVRNFAMSHSIGVYVLGTGEHAVTVINGQYWDSYDSGGKNVMYYWTKADV